MNSDDAEDNGINGSREVDIDAIGKKWQVLLTIGKLSSIAGFLLFICLLLFGIQGYPFLLDASIWMLLGGFILYVVGRLGSW